jgi:hypothetical protein
MKNTLSFTNIDTKGAVLVDGFQKAMVLKKEGRFSEAEALLIKSTEPPSIYKGHYQELFKIWRQFNRNDLKANKYQEVSNRVLNMLRIDDEMLRYWSIQQKTKLPEGYFDNDRNILVSDTKTLKKSAVSLLNEGNIILSYKLIGSLAQK